MGGEEHYPGKGERFLDLDRHAEVTVVERIEGPAEQRGGWPLRAQLRPDLAVPEGDELCVITSYSIHYTKLYEGVSVTVVPASPVGAVEAKAVAAAIRNVITSYSIHYTKLYDSFPLLHASFLQ